MPARTYVYKYISENNEFILYLLNSIAEIRAERKAASLSGSAQIDMMVGELG